MITKRKPKGDGHPIEIGRHVMNQFAKDIEAADYNELITKFKWFVSEREAIRKKKDAGEARPWTSDEILDRTKFTNIFRQHDKVSRMIFDKLNGLSGPKLVYNLIVSRLINRCDILNDLIPLTGPPAHLLEGDAVFMNPAAYQVSPGMAKLTDHGTNRETIVHHPQTVANEVYKAIISTTDIAKAVELGNKAYGGHIKFVMLQIVLDYHYLTGHYDDASDIPVGQGASALAEKFGGLDTVATVMDMKKYDVEHALCEFRKYLHREGKDLKKFSYVPNSMGVAQKD